MRKSLFKPRKKYMVLGGVALIAGILGGAAGAYAGTVDEPSTDTFLDAEGVVAEYAATTTQFPLELPPGVSFPTEIPYEFGGPNDRYEEGIGESAAYFYWRCSWMEASLQAARSADSNATGAAFDVLKKWETTDFYKEHIVEPQGTWVEDVVAPAELSGDLNPMAADYEVGCFSAEGNAQ